jgi:hypothetical protein
VHEHEWLALKINCRYRSCKFRERKKATGGKRIIVDIDWRTADSIIQRKTRRLIKTLGRNLKSQWIDGKKYGGIEARKWTEN